MTIYEAFMNKSKLPSGKTTAFRRYFAEYVLYTMEMR